MRALTPQGATVRFPPHDKRKTRTPHREVRWIKRGTTWTLSEKNVGPLESQPATPLDCGYAARQQAEKNEGPLESQPATPLDRGYATRQQAEKNV